MPAPRIAVVIGSTRPTRICADIARWIAARLEEDLAAGGALARSGVEVVDLAEVNLPLLDEPVRAALGVYEHEHTRRWSGIVRGFDAFVFVFPQYNWGYPAVLKNALDYLYAEWRDRPAAAVSYGKRGGGKAVAQLVQVLTGLHMRVLDTHVEIPIGESEVMPETSLAPHRLIDAEATLAAVRPAVRDLAVELRAALAADPEASP
ncbi:MAG: NADPH-dependent FMN reductase [Leucobacter sp.]